MLDDLNRSIAIRLQAAGRFFTEIGNEKDVANLLDCVIGHDAAAFHKFVDRLILPPEIDLTPIGKCWWLSELVEKVIANPRSTQCWATRLNLSKQEAILRFQCIRTCPAGGRTIKKDGLGNDREVIEYNDKLLKCLQSNGLVEEITVYENENSAIWWFDPPQRLCF